MHMSMKCSAVFFCMLCLIIPASTIADNNVSADEFVLENTQDLVSDPSQDDASHAGPTGADLKFAEILATRAVPAIFATASAFDTAFYHGSNAALATISRERGMELQQAAGLIRSVKISDEYEPIRTEFLSKMDTLLSEVSAGGQLKQGCSKCVTDIKRMKDYTQDFGVWTINAISTIS